MRRIWIPLVFFCASLSLQARRPNVILIMTDQQASKAVGYAGNSHLKTPAMDRIASHGVTFNNAYCSFPLSGPSRAAMFTGLYAGESGVDRNEIPLPEEVRDSTLGQLVSAAGYDCAYAGERTEALFNNGVDLMPSICDWTGSALPQGRSGKSIRPVLESGTPGQEFVVTETNFKQTAGTYGWMVRTARYKYVLYDKGLYREQLYDMETDRVEMHNLAVKERYAPIVAEHREILRRWLEDHPGPERSHRRFIP